MVDAEITSTAGKCDLGKLFATTATTERRLPSPSGRSECSITHRQHVCEVGHLPLAGEAPEAHRS